MIAGSIGIVVWIGFLFVLSQMIDVYHVEVVAGIRRYRMNWSFVLFAIVPFILMVTFRSIWIGDTAVYIKGYLNDMPSSFSQFGAYYASLSKDKLFYVVGALFHILFGDSYRFWLGAMAIVQIGTLFAVYRKYSSNVLFSFFLFIASTDYISWCYNGIRQFTAVTFCFLAAYFIIEKKYVWAVLIVLFGSLFHQSALIVLPCIFIVQGDAFNSKTLLVIGATLVALLFVSQFTTFLDSALEDTQYQNVVTDYTTGVIGEDDGTHPLRVLVYAMPTILAFIGRRRIQWKNDRLMNVCVNMSIISTGIYLISMVTSGIFIGRLPIYFSLYNYILLPWQIDFLFTKKSSYVIKFCTIGFYLIFYLVSILGIV